MTSDNPFTDAPENNNIHGWNPNWSWKVPKDMTAPVSLTDYEVDRILMENSDVPISEYHEAKRAVEAEYRAKHGRSHA
jgi:hypothetical protein